MKRFILPFPLLLLAACAAAAQIDSFEECAAAGHPIMESFPERCRTPDGRTFTRAVSSARAPQSARPSSSSVHPVSLDALRAAELTGGDLRLGAVQADTAAYVRHTITYRSGDLTISGIMNIPKGEGPFPLLILNHGHIDTSVYTNGRGLKREQDYLARHGYAVLHTDYRNHAFSDKDDENEARFRLGYTEDALAAILAVRAAALPQVDASRVGMLGHSMGGGVTLNSLIVRPDLVDAAVLFAPVSGDAFQNYERWTTRNSSRASELRERYGSPQDNPEFWRGVSAVTYLDRIQAPVLIHHGTADDSVPIAWSEDLDRRLREREKDVTYYVYPGEPHEFIRAWAQVMERTVAFFDRHVKGAE